MNPEINYTYDAFISYRHTEPDKSVAERLHRLLETFKIPKSILKNTNKKKIQRVFRDRDELPTSSNLADNISAALESSEYLIVICSPRTPQSQWVLKEIETFKKLHGQDKILALLIEGEPKDSFPEQLRFVKEVKTLEDGSVIESTVEVEPLAADIRAATEKEMFKKLKTEVLRLLAPMLNCTYDDLKQRHKERLVKTILTASISISAFFLAFGSFSTYQAIVINQKSQEISKKSEEINQKSIEINQKNIEISAQIKETQIGQSRYLADISNRYFESGDRYRAILAAQAALPYDMTNPDRPYVHEAEYAMSKALSVYEADYYFDGDIVLDHDMDVNFLDISPDGKTLLTNCRNGCIYFWNIEDGKPLGKIFTNKGVPKDNDILFVDNNTVLAVTSSNTNYDDYIICADIYGNIKWQITDFASKLTYSSDKNILVYYSVGEICFVDVGSGDLLYTIEIDKLMLTESDSSSFGKYVSCMTFSKNSDFLGVGTSIGKTFIFDMSSYSLINTLNTKYNNISDIDYSEDDFLVVISNFFDADMGIFESGKGCMEVFSPEGSKSSILFPNSSINNATFVPANPAKIVLVEGENIKVVDIITGNIDNIFSHGDSVSDYQIHNDIIIASSYDGTIKFWLMNNIVTELINYRISRSGSIYQVAQAKGKLIFSLWNSEKVYIYKPIINENTIALEGHNKAIQNAVFSPDGNLAVSYTSDNSELILWDVKNYKLLISTTYEDRISDVKFINDNIILIGFDSGKLISANASDLSPVSEIQTKPYFEFYTNKDSTLLAIPTYDETTIYSLPELKPIEAMEYGNIDYCTIIDENKIFLVDKNKTASLIDINSKNTIFRIEENGISSGAISFDGKLCVLSYKDNKIKIFDSENTNKEKVTLDNLLSEATKLLLSPDKKLLFAQFADQSVSIFDTDNGNLLRTIDKDMFPTTLKKVVFSNNNDKIALIGISWSHILDTATLKILATADISDINKDFSKLVSNGHGVSTSLYIMPCYTTQMLIDEAKRQLNGRVLTEQEKADMFIN
ncbi:MAG: TIR domain-containing protein [Clostridiaceae bacterium]|jgi:WD40 repeat protein|nr:TIR domain-containing protein [Clostridiaceae bacterium]